jgi:D-3-phosphoglycerate dehydrogenase
LVSIATLSTSATGSLLIAPHRFKDLVRELALSEEAGLKLVVAEDQAQFVAALPEARAILMTPFARLDAQDLERATECRAVVRYGVGYDNIDVGAAARLGIPVAIVPDASVEEVALHGVAMALALFRRLPQADASVRAGKWEFSYMAGAHRLSRATTGVVGLGRIGSRAAGHFAALGATVLGHDPSPPLVSSDVTLVALDELLARSDIVSLHLPLSAQTRLIMSAERIAQLRRGAIVINVSRGGLIDERALVQALASGAVGGAALDVFEQEPLPRDHPLRDAPNVLFSPHIAYRSEEAMDELQEKAVEQASLALRGLPMPHAVHA